MALAFGLTLLAGLSTGVGSAITLFARRTNTRFLSISLGFSAGVMLYASLVELYPAAAPLLADAIRGLPGRVAAALALFAGALLVALLDRLLPDRVSPHEAWRSAADGHAPPAPYLWRTGYAAAVIIAIHNVPEGLATFVSALDDPRIGVPVAAAIAIHNVPEGIAISVAIYFATGSRGLAFVLSALSGLVEPISALLGYVVLASLWSDPVVGVALAGVAGMMIFLAFDILLPAAVSSGEHHAATYALLVGMAAVAATLLFLS